MDIYHRQHLLDQYKSPHNYGHIKNPTKSVKMLNSSCGDEIELDVIIEEGKITKVGFEGKGCVISTASASILTDFVKGKTVEELKSLNYEKMNELLGIEISPARIKCLTLPLEAVKKAVE